MILSSLPPAIMYSFHLLIDFSYHLLSHLSDWEITTYQNLLTRISSIKARPTEGHLLLTA
jgi:hypothetical protein